jgi:hypothetical protein
VFPLADVLRSKTEPAEAEVRERLARLRGMMRRAAAGNEIAYVADFGSR